MRKLTSPKRSGIVIAIIATTMFFVTLMSSTVYATGNIDCEYISGNNINYNNYSRWTSPVYSYLTTKDNGYMRVQGNVSEGVTVAYYDSNFKLTGRRIIACELPIFGAFYETSDNYYIVSGQNNTEEDNSKEVFRITKYDKNWNRLGSCSLKGANTIHPFDAGSCRLDHSGNYLVIRTCHEMYTSNDGLNHQANVTILVNTSSMTIADSHTSSAGNYAGYVSHSFNQFIKLEDNKIVAVDHGDAYPRSICLMKYPTNITNGSFNSSSVSTKSVISFSGTTGNNTTGASVGGFEISSSSYLVAGSSVVQDDNNTSRSTRNAFVASVNKSGNNVQINWLTNFSEGETSVGNPFLVKIGTDSYMMLWARGSKVYYTKINGSGQKVGEIYSMDGNLSDCVPLVSNNKLIWYTWKNAEETFYSISMSDLSQTYAETATYDHDYEYISTENGLATLRCTKCGNEKEARVPTDFTILWKNTSTDNGFYYSTRSLDISEEEKYWIYDKSYSAVSDETLGEMVFEAEDPNNCTINTATGIITFKDAGNYVIRVYPKFNPTLTKTYTIKVTKPLESVALSADLKSPQKYGRTVKYTAIPNGGKGTLTYKYTVTNSSGTVVKTQESTNAALTWTADSIGDYTVKVTATDSYDQKTAEDSIGYTFQKDNLKIKDNKSITTDPITYEDKVSTIQLNNASFAAETTGAAVSGSIVFENPESVLNAGVRSFNWRFVPNNENYNEYAGLTTVEVQKRTPSVTNTPSATVNVYKPSLKLEDIALTGGVASTPSSTSLVGSWSWADPNTKQNAPGGKYTAVFTPSNQSNYNTAGVDVEVTVTKAAPYVLSVSAGEITYGQSLSDSGLSGSAQYSAEDASLVEGSFSWDNGSIKPSVSDSNSTEYDVLFTPNDATNYKSITTKTTITVNKAEWPTPVPQDSYDVPWTTKQVSTGIISDASNWSFDDNDIGIDLEVGVAKTITAHYTGTDKDNFEYTSKEITITRQPCNHSGGKELRDKKDATCTEPGYTGDEYCLVCGEKTDDGAEIDINPSGHEWGAWTKVDDNQHKRVCRRNEQHTETANHTWNNGVVTTKATYTAAGVKTFTCTACGATRKESIAKLQYAAGENPNQKAKDGTPTGKGASAAAANKAITSSTSEEGPKGSKFSPLILKSTVQTNTSITLAWTKNSKATKYVIYGNVCGKNNKLKKLKTVTGKSCKITKISKTLKKGTYHKFMIVALNSKNNVVSTSKVVHVATKGGKVGNNKAVTIKAKVNKNGKAIRTYKALTATKIKKGKSITIKTSLTPANKKLTVKKHRGVCYESSNPKIATVNAKGKIIAKKKGTCYIYAYAQNGVFKKLKITVK